MVFGTHCVWCTRPSLVSSARFSRLGVADAYKEDNNPVNPSNY